MAPRASHYQRRWLATGLGTRLSGPPSLLGPHCSQAAAQVDVDPNQSLVAPVGLSGRGGFPGGRKSSGSRSLPGVTAAARQLPYRGSRQP